MTAFSETPLDLLIHEAARLQLVAMLNECAAADFGFLLRATGLTRGNLSVHMSKLVAAGYVDEKKEFVGRMPRTECRLTARGRAAFRSYIAAWEKLTANPLMPKRRSGRSLSQKQAKSQNSRFANLQPQFPQPFTNG